MSGSDIDTLIRRTARAIEMGLDRDTIVSTILNDVVPDKAYLIYIAGKLLAK